MQTITIDVGAAKSVVNQTLPQPVLHAIHELTSYELPAAYFAGLLPYQSRVYLFKEKTGSFPTGLLQRILSVLERFDYPVQVHDRRQTEYVPTATVLERLSRFSRTLRDYQAEGLAAGMANPYGLFWWPTGSGKTTLFSALATCYDLQTLILTHRRELLYQLQRELQEMTGREIGIVGDGHWQPRRWTVGIVNSFMTDDDLDRKSEVQQYLASVEHLIADECFPAGTMVGSQRIEDIVVGDLVPSFDPQTLELSYKRVVRTFRSRCQALVRIRAGGQIVVCTPGHPFWTKRGWVPAWALREYDMVCYTMWDGRKNSDQVPLVRESGHDHWQQSSCSLSKTRTSLLQSCLFRCLSIETKFRNHVQDQSQVRIRPNEAQQSDDETRSSGACDHNFEAYGLETTNSRRQWSSVAGASENFGIGVELGNRSRGSNQTSNRWLSIALQDRYCKSVVEDRDRSRWEFASCNQSESSRQTKNRVLDFTRVDRVEILEPGSDGEFGGLCPGGEVFNLELEDQHTYLANGFGVHNCHHLGASSWWKIAHACSNTRARHGFSGTCFRTDNADLHLLANTGDVISRYTTSQMIEWGWLSRPHIYMPEVGGPVCYSTDWRVVEKEALANNDARNSTGCQFIYDRYNRGDQILAMVRLVPHGHAIKDMLTHAFGISQRDIRYMSGSNCTPAREKALADFRYGRFPILIGTSIYNEGIDLPMVGAGVNFAGGLGDIATVQRLGRVIRKKPDPALGDVNPEIEQVIRYHDFDDRGHKYTRKHARQRKKVYEDEPAFILRGAYDGDEDTAAG